MDDYNFTESGIILGIKSHEDLRRLNHSSTQFSNINRPAWEFVLEYLDEHKDFPDNSLIIEKFPNLKPEASEVSLDYLFNEFKKQVVYRRSVEAIKSHQNSLKENPEVALSSLITSLSNIEVDSSSDINVYNSGDTYRLELYEWKESQRQSGSALDVLGVPTPIRSLNATGVGLLQGEMMSIFARPTGGKTWLCVKAAAIAAYAGINTLFISTEMPVSQIDLRLDVIFGRMKGYNFSHTGLRSGVGVDKEKYKEFLANNADRTLISCDSIEGSSITTAGIRGLVRKHKPGLLIIDGLHLVGTASKSNAVWEKMHSLFYDIKTCAVNNNVPIIVSTQANRKAANMYKPPSPDEVAFGDAMFQASDVVLSLSLLENTANKRVVSVHKQRDGESLGRNPILEWDVDKGLIKEESFSEIFGGDK